MERAALLQLLDAMDVLGEFSAEQREWVADHGSVVALRAGEDAFHEGDTSTGFWLLLSGRVAVLREVDGEPVTASSTSQLGAWGGRIPLTGEPAPLTLRAETDATFLVLSDADADAMVGGGMPIARHIISGIQVGTRRLEARLRERDRLASLGRLSAGLAHELNNPAAAVGRAAAQLRDALVEQQRLAVCLRADAGAAERLAEAQADLAARAAGSAPALSAVARADAEDAVAERLEAWGVEGAWDRAGELVDAGVDAEWLQERLSGLAADVVPAAVGVLAAAATAQLLATEIEQASQRISELVASVKSYSNMDGASQQQVDVRVGLDNTLTMLKHEVKDLEVVREYAEDLPLVEGNPGELNQVWTNLVDNAADALHEAGRRRLVVRAHRDPDGDGVCVEVTDEGAGMPPEVRDRVFEPFFTTKGVGEGTGLGLDLVWRLVTQAHHGRVEVDSEPGTGTTVRVALPLRQPVGAAPA